MGDATVVAPDARLFTCKSRLTERARGSIYHWGSSAAVPAPLVCSGNSPHTRRFPWQPLEPSGAAISTSSSFFLFLAARPATHSSFRRPGEGSFSYKHFSLTTRGRLSSEHQSWLQASPAALCGRWCSRHCTYSTARCSACHGALAHTRASRHTRNRNATTLKIFLQRASISKSHQKFKTLWNVEREVIAVTCGEGRPPSVRHRLPEPTVSAALSAASK